MQYSALPKVERIHSKRVDYALAERWGYWHGSVATPPRGSAVAVALSARVIKTKSQTNSRGFSYPLFPWSASRFGHYSVDRGSMKNTHQPTVSISEFSCKWDDIWPHLHRLETKGEGGRENMLAISCVHRYSDEEWLKSSLLIKNGVENNFGAMKFRVHASLTPGSHFSVVQLGFILTSWRLSNEIFEMVREYGCRRFSCEWHYCRIRNWGSCVTLEFSI